MFAALARFALGGPRQWRQALTTALMSVGKRIVEKLDDRYVSPQHGSSSTHARHADARPSIAFEPHPSSTPHAYERTTHTPADTAWAVWM
jgi:hypothetical protein